LHVDVETGGRDEQDLIQQRLTLRDAIMGCKREVALRMPVACDITARPTAIANTSFFSMTFSSSVDPRINQYVGLGSEACIVSGFTSVRD
jgi:hypothetical protein